MLFALARLDHRIRAQPFDKGIPHVRHSGFPVGAQLPFHLGDAVLHHILFVFREREQFEHRRIPLDQFGGGEPGRYMDPLGMILDQMRNRVDRPMYRTDAEILPFGRGAGLRNRDSPFHHLVDPLVFDRRDREDRHSQLPLHRFDFDGPAVAADLVHHIERNHHRNPQLDELHTEVEVALDIGRIKDIDDPVRMAAQQEVAGDDLLVGVGGKRVDARQVNHRHISMAPELPILALNRHAGEVPHMLVRPGELVEQGGLPAVLIARQCKNHLAASLISSISISFASSRRRVSSYPRRCSSIGSPIGATLRTMTLVFGVNPMSSRCRRNAPLPPTCRIIPLCPIFKRSNVIALFHLSIC